MIFSLLGSLDGVRTVGQVVGPATKRMLNDVVCNRRLTIDCPDAKLETCSGVYVPTPDHVNEYCSYLTILYKG
jgi:hypothetical protein